MANPSTLDPRAVTRDVFSASLGSICCCYVGQPFDTVKVRMQTNPTTYSAVFPSVAQILRAEGVTAFWKGAVPTCFGMIAENAMAFGVNEGLKRAFPEDKGSFSTFSTLIRPFWMGALTGKWIMRIPVGSDFERSFDVVGCCSALVLLPSEIIKAKLQVVEGSGATANGIMKSMMRKQGTVSSFMIGLDAQLARDGLFYAVFFGGYEMFVYLIRTTFPSVPDEANFFLSGGFAGMLGWACAMPVDVPKTNVQSSYQSKVFGSFAPELISIARQRGISGLYSGLGPTLIRAFPANAALFLGVEMGKRTFDDYVWVNHT